MEYKCWLVVYQDTGEYLCYAGGKYFKKPLGEINQKSLFQFWSGNYQDLQHFFHEYGGPEDRENIILVQSEFNEKGEVIL